MRTVQGIILFILMMAASSMALCMQKDTKSIDAITQLLFKKDFTDLSKEELNELLLVVSGNPKRYRFFSGLKLLTAIIDQGPDLCARDQIQQTSLHLIASQKKWSQAPAAIQLMLKSLVKSSFDGINARKKVRVILIGNKDKNSPLSLLPKELLLSLLFYAPDCITGKKMFDAVVAVHSASRAQSLDQFAQEHGNKSELMEMKNLLECQDMQGRIAFDYNRGNLLLDPERTAQTYKKLFLATFIKESVSKKNDKHREVFYSSGEDTSETDEE